MNVSDVDMVEYFVVCVRGHFSFSRWKNNAIQMCQHLLIKLLTFISVPLLHASSIITSHIYFNMSLLIICITTYCSVNIFFITGSSVYFPLFCTLNNRFIFIYFIFRNVNGSRIYTSKCINPLAGKLCCAFCWIIPMWCFFPQRFASQGIPDCERA